MKLTSSAFNYGENIPDKYTCRGEDVNPPLSIDGIPDGTKSLVLIMDDPDATTSASGMWVHWVVWNVPIVSEINEDSVPKGAVQGLNDFNKNNYGGPCPPSGTHRYFFKLYALDRMLDLSEGSRKKDVESAMQEYVLEKVELMGLVQSKREL